MCNIYKVEILMNTAPAMYDDQYLNIVDPTGQRYVNLDRNTFIRDLYFATPQTLDQQIFNVPFKYPRDCPTTPLGTKVETDSYSDVSQLKLSQNRFNYEKVIREPINKDTEDYKIVYGNYSMAQLQSGYPQNQMKINTDLFADTPSTLAQRYTNADFGLSPTGKRLPPPPSPTPIV